MVLIAINPESDKLSQVQDPKELINWPKLKAYVENIDGRNRVGDQMYPPSRVGQFIGIDESITRLRKNSITFKDTEAKKIQSGCHNLYEKLWSQVGQERPEDTPSHSSEDLKKKLKLREELKRKKLPIGFAERFVAFSKSYHNEMSTCEKFVYHGNINDNVEKFWFLSYMGIFFRLHKDGFYFDCTRKTWSKNIINSQGELTYKLENEIASCKEKDIDLAMSYLDSFLSGLKIGNPYYYRFIDYDNHSYGTHLKLYSWVKVPSRKFECSDDKNENFHQNIKIFPEDATWKQRNVSDVQSDSKIIY